MINIPSDAGALTSVSRYLYTHIAGESVSTVEMKFQSGFSYYSSAIVGSEDDIQASTRADAIKNHESLVNKVIAG